MKSNFLIGFVTFFVTMVLSITIFNLFNAPSNKSYSFERIYSDMPILNFEKKYNKMASGDFVMSVKSDKYIAEINTKPKNKNENSCTIYFNDLNFNIESRVNLDMPIGSNVLMSNPIKIIYTKSFKLYEHSLAINASKEIKLKKFKVISLEPLDSLGKKFLCFGELEKNKKFNLGFFVININSKQIIESKIIELNDFSNVPISILKYSGRFTSSYDKKLKSYYCDKYSKVYFFNNLGDYVKVLSTNENTPLPKILTNNQGVNFYSQGKTWYTNKGVIIKNKNVFVFSCASEEKNYLIIDKYSFSNLKYQKSYKLKYENLNSENIKNIFIDIERIVISFDFYYASFIFSRHI